MDSGPCGLITFWEGEAPLWKGEASVLGGRGSCRAAALARSKPRSAAEWRQFLLV